MTTSQGTLSSYSNLSNLNQNIIVDSGQDILIRSFGHLSLFPPHSPLILKNVFHAPKLIKKLISVQRFTTDNNASIDFDRFAFSVKDFTTWRRIMRCDSTGDLYPILNVVNNPDSVPSTFTALSSSLWHSY
ncbi:hypothetical protein RND71_011897 [Anisodus tanguticus]|uniref:Uncharacterized protein n=1 Tax=Anisodus tanguticus TaxID=243964 RepID=A0AAE1SE58_9SOLA|nr:hypothetical protein RND71_011897 [Anisodus tanguticus]